MRQNTWAINSALFGMLMANTRAGRNGCRIWTKCTSKTGYGQVWHEGRLQYAHRLVLIAVGRDIPSGMCACHKCDVPGCINPDHLFVGTHADNAADRDAKGRHWRHTQTHCKRGHELSKENIYPNGRGRNCKQCARERASAAYEREAR